jgi:hypothetical protein
MRRDMEPRNHRGRPRRAHTSAVSSAELMTLVLRCRRRILLVMFASHSGTTLAIASIVVAAGFRLRLPTSLLSVWIGAAAGLALGAAALLVWLRCPTVRETGATLDRTLGLSDHVVAALEVRDSSEAVSALIVRDALARVREVKPAQIFQMKPGVPLAKLVVGAAVALLVQVALPADRRASDAFRAVGSPASTQATAIALPAAAAGGPDQTRTLTSSPQASASASQTDMPAQGQRESAAVPSSGESGPSSGPRRVGTNARGGRGGNDLEPGDSGRSGDGLSEANQSAPAAGERGATSGASRLTGAAPGTGAAGRAGDRPPTGAGGVRRGEPERADTRAEGISLDAQSGFGVSSRDTWSSAEAAVSRGEVPPRFRSYVRDYFSGVRRPQRQ